MSEEFKNNHKDDKDFKKILARAAAVALVIGVVGGGSFQVMDHIGDKYLAQKQVNAAQEESEETITTEVSKAEDGKVEMTTLSQSSTSDEEEYSVKEVTAYAMPSMVAITNQSVQTVQEYFFGQAYEWEEESESTGSGVIVDQNEEELLIATNNHVVEGATTLSVCFTVDAEDSDDLVVAAEIKGTDPNHDLAIVSVKLADISDDVKSKLRVAEIGSSEDLELGEQVVAIGNALGYGQSVTSGYVSALDREIDVDGVSNTYIQTDAAINPGNSGGALLNMQGQLIGINSVKASATGVEGMGYAIPIDTAMPIFEELKSIQARELVDEENRGYMGIIPRDITEEARQIYNMPTGAFVYEVTEDSAAEEGGMKRGDIITKMDGVIISSSDDLYSRMEYYAAGDEVKVTVQRSSDGEYVEQELTIVLDERPEETTSSSSSSGSIGSSRGSQETPYGGDESQEEDGDQGEVEEDPFSQIFPEYFRNGR